MQIPYAGKLTPEQQAYLDAKQQEIRALEEGNKIHWTYGPSVEYPANIAATASIHPTAWVASCVTIGENVVVGPNVSIGWEGFGYTTDTDGIHHRREHPFGVVIQDNVEIGAGVTIDRGRYRDTVIGAGTKIDANVFIAHNSLIGRDCLIIANSQISGSCEIGDNCHIGPAAMLTDHIKVGDGGRCGMGAVVIRDVPAGVTVVGNPAKDIEKRRKPKPVGNSLDDNAWAMAFGDGSDEFSLPVPRPDMSELGQRQRAAEKGWQAKCR